MKRIKFQLEYVIDCKQSKLYEYISTAHGLSNWFANTVHEDNEGQFNWKWDDLEARANVIEKKKNKFIQFSVEENPANEFFELRIDINEVTRDLALIIIDFANEDEVEDYKDLWTYQVSNLTNLISEEDEEKI